MCVRAKKLGTFYADGSIAEGGPFGRAGYNADVVGHDRLIRYLLRKQVKCRSASVLLAKLLAR